MFYPNEKWLNATMDVVKDSKVDQEVKLYCILDLLHSGGVSFQKAKELCVETGLFKNHWTEVDSKLGGIWGEYYKED
jgi:hypothetical protein